MKYKYLLLELIIFSSVTDKIKNQYGTFALYKIH